MRTTTEDLRTDTRAEIELTEPRRCDAIPASDGLAYELNRLEQEERLERDRRREEELARLREVARYD